MPALFEIATSGANAGVSSLPLPDVNDDATSSWHRPPGGAVNREDLGERTRQLITRTCALPRSGNSRSSSSASVFPPRSTSSGSRSRKRSAPPSRPASLTFSSPRPSEFSYFAVARPPQVLICAAAACSSQARTASARLVSTIARFELDKGVWPELLPWLWNMASSSTASHREVALQTTFMLLDSIAIAPTSAGDKPSNQIPALLQLLGKTVADPESLTVRTWSVRSLGKLAEYVEPGEEHEIVSGLTSLVAFPKLPKADASVW